MLIKKGFYQDAIIVSKQALFAKRHVGGELGQKRAIGEGVGLSPQIWSIYVDLERNYGTFETTKAAYKRMLELKVMSPIILLNYVAFLESKACPS